MRAAASFTRRACLGAALAAPFGFARAASTPRVVALDWGWVSTLLGLGLRPAGVAEQRLYRDWVGAPALPEGVPELGLRTDPSLDTLQALRPDLILINSLDSGIRRQLEAIAPTLENPTFAENRAPLANAKAAATLLGARLDRLSEAAALIASAETRIGAARARLQTSNGRACLPLSLLDRRHVMIHGDGSLFVDVLRAVGMRGLFPGATSMWGTATVGVAELAGLPPGDILLIDPVSPLAADALEPTGLFARLAAADGRAIHRLPAAWGFGDISAAARFVDLLADALGREAPT